MTEQIDWEQVISKSADLANITDSLVVEQLRAIVKETQGREYGVELKDVGSAIDVLDKGPEFQIRFALLSLVFIQKTSKIKPDRARQQNHLEHKQDGEGPGFEVSELLGPAARSSKPISNEDVASMIRFMMENATNPVERDTLNIGFVVSRLVGRIMRRKLPLSDEDLLCMVLFSTAYDPWELTNPVLGAVERFIGDGPPADSLRVGLTELAEGFQSPNNVWELISLPENASKIRQRIQRILKNGEALVLDGVDAWTIAAQASMDGLGDDETAWCMSLLDHCKGATGSKPTKRWLRTAEKTFEDEPDGAFVRFLSIALQAIGTKAPFMVRDSRPVPGEPSLIAEEFADCLRGLVWMGLLRDSEPLIELVGDTAIRCFEKLPDVGPRSPKIGNACVLVLGRSELDSAVVRLIQMGERTKNRAVRSAINKALDVIAKRRGLEPGDLKELSVPTFGFDKIGSATHTFGEHTARVEVEGVSSVKVYWHSPDGKVRKSVPKEIIETFASDFKSLQQSVREIKKRLAEVNANLEVQLLSKRSFTYTEWKTRYLDHPLVGDLVRRLIWHFESDDRTAIACWTPDGMVNENAAVFEPNSDASVSLWHPVDSTDASIRYWREWLDQNEITQPFRQAHREVYVTTDTEHTTKTYSDRFATHVIKQKEFKALCDQRRWSFSLYGPFEDEQPTPFRTIPGNDWRAVFCIHPYPEAADPKNPSDFDTDMLNYESYYLYLTVGQVRFYKGNNETPSDLADVPPLVFSETMYDCDNFVSVCRVEMDPRLSSE